MKKEKPSLLAKCGRSLVIKRKRQPSASRGQSSVSKFQSLRSKFQSFKVFSQSFKVLIAQDGKVGTVIHHSLSLKLHTTGRLRYVLIWFQFQQCLYHIQAGRLGIESSTLYSTLIGNSFFLVPHQQPIGGNIIEEMPPMSRSRPCNEDLRSWTFFTASRVSVAVGHMFFCQDLICHKT